MMTEEQRDLVVSLALHKVSENDFLRRFPTNPRDDVDYIPRMIKDARDRQDADQLECALLLYFVFGSETVDADMLSVILPEDWHRQHENIAMILQRLRDPISVDSLYDVALAKYAYLEFDDNFALAVKAIWALGDIGTGEAIAKLNLLAQSDNKIISDNAKQQIARIESRKL